MTPKSLEHERTGPTKETVDVVLSMVNTTLSKDCGQAKRKNKVVDTVLTITDMSGSLDPVATNTSVAA